MSNPEEKSEKVDTKNKSKEEKIYIPEDEENVEEIDEEDNDIEELNSDDSQAEIHILEDNSNKNNKRKRKKPKKDSEESDYYSSEESPKDRNTSTLNENENENDGDTSNHLKRKRRRRKELDGPGHTCPDCGKCYYSLPALNMHRRTKHDYLKGDWGRGRGRPKKEAQVETNGDVQQIQEIRTDQKNIISYSSIENKVARFFEGEHRKPVYGEIINKNVILNIIAEYKKNYLGIIGNIEDESNQNFFNKIMEEWDNKKNNGDKKEEEKEDNMTYINLNEKQNENKKKCFDFALVKYFKECAHFTNIHFLKTIYSILILFREGINDYFYEMKINNTNSSSNGTNEEKSEGIYTEANNCDEKIPDIINEIITKYFEPNSFFAFKQKDVKDIILHFFHWLYSYSYTDKKITYS